jgi:hypothetical protein
LNGNIDLTNGAKAAIDATPEKAEITKATTFDQVAPEGYIWENGTTLVAVGAEIEGYQLKVVGSSESTKDEGNDITTNGVRILTKVDTTTLNDFDDYGYVVAKVSGKDQAAANFTNLKANGGNGEKTISCVNTTNHGIKDIDNSYITLAVNGMEAGDQVAVRFYIVKDGKTYYANYTNVVNYSGIIATMA